MPFADSPEAAVGGIEVQAGNLASALLAHGEVALVAHDREGAALPPGLLAVSIGAAPPRQGRIRRAFLVLPFVVRLWRGLRAADADVYLQLGLGYETLVTALFCRLHRRAFAFLWAADADLTHRVGWPPGPMDRILARARRAADLQACQTQEQRARLPPDEAARSILLPPPLTRAPWLPSDGDAVLWVGWIRPVAKRPDRFLDLAARLPGRRFVMVGGLEGPPEFQEEMRHRIRGLPNVEWAGPRRRGAMPAVYRQARVLVNTSDMEGFPNTFLEAMACGVPVVSFRFDPNGILGHDGAGVCVQDDAEALAPAVESMFDEAKWTGHRKAAFEVARAHGPEAIAARLVAAIEAHPGGRRR